ncbi:hypothetical protein PIB30_075857 [Stylosanthes scabra]|uniref:Uncharacterized protein n=1 Tax=Stylosanthes scabra TaxID=79078 RepID=A0ABU6XNG2_9FABA|nr:hypothetical protein [Stylosanthes scabra]
MEFIEKKYMSDADNLIRAEYLDRFLTADRFYKDKSSFWLKPLEFDFIEPQVGQQQPLSRDSGVWICLWMIESHQCTNFDLEVSDATRMTIALNLVTYEYNQIGDMISERAVHYWDLEMIKSQKKGKKKTRATEIREVTQSPTI